MQRRYVSFGYLARLYFPGCSTQKNAVRSLNRYIQRCLPLLEELRKTGFSPYTHRQLSPLQQDIIFRHLGDPFDD